MDSPSPGNRARRALPLIAGAVTAAVVAGLLYLRPAVAPTRPAVPSPSPTAPILPPPLGAEYDFISPSLGWALIDDPASQDTRYWVYKTNDATRHWTLQTSGSAAGFSDLAIHFFDRSHGYFEVSARAVFTTSDGGSRWNSLHVPQYDYGVVAFADPADGWLAAPETTAGKGPGPIHLYTTADAGVSWAELPSVSAYGAMAFRNRGEGWLASSSSQGLTMLYKTEDGGSTWHPEPLPLPTLPSATAATDEPFLELLPGGGVYAVSGPWAYVSDDAGATWREIPAPPGNALFERIVFQDREHWWVMPSGNLFKTADAGRTWQHVVLQLDDYDYVLGIIDSKHAWAKLQPSPQPQGARGSGLALTSDGGVHWTYAAVPRPA